MREIALHLLDIAENSVAAEAKNITIAVCEDMYSDKLTASVQDDGKGMTPEMVARVVDPFTTSRTTRKVGLGIPLLKAAAEACEGWLRIESTLGKGTLLEVRFQRTHIDRMPLGDLAGTLLTLLVAYPDIHWVFNYEIVLANGEKEATCFDDEIYKETLDGVPLTEPGVLAFFREILECGIQELQQKLDIPTAAGILPQ